MCGEVRISDNAAQAVEYAIAYAKSFEEGPQYQRYGTALEDDSHRREIALDFIADYTPEAQRAEARKLLAERDELDTEVDYWREAVDASFIASLRALNSGERHEKYAGYDG